MSSTETRIVQLNINRGGPEAIERAFDQGLIGPNDLTFVIDDTEYATKDDLNNYYTKDESDALLDEKITALDEMPEIDEDVNGAIIQYIGETNELYTEAYFYKAYWYENGDKYTFNDVDSRLSTITSISINSHDFEMGLLENHKTDTTATLIYVDDKWLMTFADSSFIEVTDEDLREEFGISYEGEPEAYVEGSTTYTVINIDCNTGNVTHWEQIDVQPASGDASQITYHNPEYPTVEAALDKLLYVMPSVSLSGGANYEVGYTVNTTTLNWTVNKTITSQSLNQGIGSLAPNVRTYTYNTPITSNKTFTITVSDGTNSKSSSTTVGFLPKRYWGTTTTETITDAQILALSSELASGRAQKRTFDCSGGKYWWFVIPTSYCSGIKFKDGNGLSVTLPDSCIETRTIVNAQGTNTQVNIYRGEYIQTSATVVMEVL